MDRIYVFLIMLSLQIFLMKARNSQQIKLWDIKEKKPWDKDKTFQKY